MTNKEIVATVGRAFLDGDIEKALEHMTEDVHIAWPGMFALEPGKDAVRAFFGNAPGIEEGSTGEIIAEGDRAVATGWVRTRREDGSLRRSFFCDVYTLEEGKVKAVNSYIVMEEAS